jgi:hypothetical protein
MEIKIIKSLEVVPIGSVFLYPENPREIEKSQFEKLKKSITTNGFIDPLVVNRRSYADYKPEERKPTVVGGNMRWRAANELGLKEVPVVWIDVGRNEEKIINIALNRISGKWDIDKLEKMVYEISNKDLKLDLDLTGLEDWELKLYNPGFDGEVPDFNDGESARKSLVEKFGVPPFSVLDSTRDYWIRRKKEWLSLGMKSEIGRDKMQESMIHLWKMQKRNQLNPRSAMEKVLDNPPAWTGISIFDPVLCEIMYLWFCPQKGIIVDPFAGGSVRGIVANYLGYFYNGIDLSEEQISENIKQGETILKDKVKPNWFVGDGEDVGKILPDVKADFIFSCPPYYDLEVYSKNPKDLSNMSTEDFNSKYEKIIKNSVEILKNDRFACFVVGNVRDKSGYYSDLVGETIRIFKKFNMGFYGDIVLRTSFAFAGMRVSSFKFRKVVKIHQNVLVFYKGDISKIKDNYNEIEITNFSEEEPEEKWEIEK